MDLDYQAIILNHYIRNWGGDPKIYLWDRGPFQKLPHDFRILEFTPNKNRDMWSYATCCMSQPGDIFPVELHIFSSKQDSSIIELLTSIVYYHRLTSNLSLNHTINFGRPWQEDSNCEYGLISLPYLDGPKLENLEVYEYSTPIKFYWIVPITIEEVNFKNDFGVSALENIFEQGINYLDPNRKSLV